MVHPIFNHLKNAYTDPTQAILTKFCISETIKISNILFRFNVSFYSLNFSGSNGNGTPGSVGRMLRNDLLVAADSVTNAMSTLVRELNSGTSP